MQQTNPRKERMFQTYTTTHKKSKNHQKHSPSTTGDFGSANIQSIVQRNFCTPKHTSAGLDLPDTEHEEGNAMNYLCLVTSPILSYLPFLS